MKIRLCTRPAFCLLLISLFLTGCGKDPLRKAEKYEKLGRYPTAILEYEKYFLKNPDGSRTAEALFRTGEIYRLVIKDFAKAKNCYEKIIRKHKNSPWSARAELSFMNCPDYFPLEPGLMRQFGDSDSSGKYMQMIQQMEPIQKTQRFKVRKQIYAGENSLGKEDIVYEKRDRELREFPKAGLEYTVILLYPPEKNRTWESLRNGKRVRFTIEDDKKAIEVNSGVYVYCLKVREQFVDMPGTWKNYYYAPETGLVLVSVSTEKNETPIMELLSKKVDKKIEKKESPPLFQRIKLWFKDWGHHT